MRRWSTSYVQRRGFLEDLDLNAGCWSTPPANIGEGQVLFAATREMMGLEGFVAKRVDSRYRPGLRSMAWTKTRHSRSEGSRCSAGCRRRNGDGAEAASFPGFGKKGDRDGGRPKAQNRHYLLQANTYVRPRIKGVN